jgi:hypothetical protein
MARAVRLTKLTKYAHAFARTTVGRINKIVASQGTKMENRKLEREVEDVALDIERTLFLPLGHDNSFTRTLSHWIGHHSTKTTCLIKK